MEITGFDISLENTLSENNDTDLSFSALNPGDFFILSNGHSHVFYDYDSALSSFQEFLKEAKENMHFFIKIPTSCYTYNSSSAKIGLEFNALDLTTQQLLYIPNLHYGVTRIHGCIKCMNLKKEEEFLETAEPGKCPKSTYKNKDYIPKHDENDMIQIPIQMNNFTCKKDGTRIPYLRLGVKLDFKDADKKKKASLGYGQTWSSIISNTKEGLEKLNGFDNYYGTGMYCYYDYELKETGRVKTERVQEICF